MKDWNGNPESIFKTIGATNHSDINRDIYDYYATDPRAIDALLNGGATLSKNLWEPCAGEGHLCRRLLECGYDVKATDLIDRGYGRGGIDFLQVKDKFDGDIITNPPYAKAQMFVEHALELVSNGHKVFMFLKLTFLEGQARRELFDRRCLRTVYVFSSRIKCARNGDFDAMKGSAVAYAWFEFEKGYSGETNIKWI